MLAANNTYNGTTTISGGTLQVDAGGATGTLARGLSSTISVCPQPFRTYTLANAISGSGSVAQNGSGWLGLSGTNTYTGSTTVSSGTLQVLGPAALPDGGLVVAAGGTVIFGIRDNVGSTWSSHLRQSRKLSRLCAQRQRHEWRRHRDFCIVGAQ